MTPIKSLCLQSSALVVCLALPIGVPTASQALRAASVEQQNAARGAVQAQPQTQQTPPPGTPAAQRPPDPRGPGNGPWEWEWWKDPEIQKTLGLTEAKAKMIGRIYDDRVKRVQPIVEKYQTEFKELEKMAAERQVSVEVFALQVTAVDALRSELSKSRAIMNYRISRELTPEQNTKLREIRDKQFGGRGGRGGDRQK